MTLAAADLVGDTAESSAGLRGTCLGPLSANDFVTASMTSGSTSSGISGLDHGRAVAQVEVMSMMMVMVNGRGRGRGDGRGGGGREEVERVGAREHQPLDVCLPIYRTALNARHKFCEVEALVGI